MDRCTKNRHGRHDYVALAPFDDPDGEPVGLHCRSCGKDVDLTTDKVVFPLLSMRMEDCSHCGHSYAMHSGGNVCPACGESVFVPTIETSGK